jgi:hypothetical protein
VHCFFIRNRTFLISFAQATRIWSF